MEEAGSFSAAAKAADEAAERQREASKVRPDGAPSHTSLTDLCPAIIGLAGMLRLCLHLKCASLPSCSAYQVALLVDALRLQAYPVLLHSMLHRPVDISQS